MQKLSTGFTLLELVIGLTVCMIILAFGLPFSTMLYKNNQLQVISDKIKSATRQAQLQALLKNKTLVLAPLSKEGDWSSGIVLFIDNKLHQFKPESTVSKWAWSSTHVTVNWYGFQSQHHLIFAPHSGHNALSGYFLLHNGIQQIKMVVNRLGRVKEIELK